MIQRWKTESEYVYDILLDDVVFTCSYVKLPVFVNEHLESSETGLINLLNLYTKFVEFLDLGRVKKLNEEPYCVVMCLDKVSELFVSYINQLHLKKYGLTIQDYTDFDIKTVTPYCQYAYEAAKEEANIIKEVLKEERGLTLNVDPEDTDWT